MSDQLEEIIVEVGRDGSLNLETFGFIGSSCEAESRLLSELLGTATDVQHKPEYNHVAPNNRQGQQQRMRF